MDPTTSPEFTTLRAVHASLSEGGLPPEEERTPTDDARVVTFFVLQELLRFLTEVRRAWLRGKPFHVIVESTRQEKRRATIAMRIELIDT